MYFNFSKKKTSFSKSINSALVIICCARALQSRGNSICYKFFDWLFDRKFLAPRKLILSATNHHTEMFVLVDSFCCCC